MSNDCSVLSEKAINKCISEEAVPRLVRHAINLGKSGYNHVHIRTVDSDVVILSIASHKANKHGVSELFLLHGLPSKEKYYNVHDICSDFGLDICRGLSFFHALTSCDATSSFYKVGNGKFWNKWMEMNKHSNSLTIVFQQLSDQPKSITPDMLDTIAKFIYYVYNPNQRQNSSFSQTN